MTAAGGNRDRLAHIEDMLEQNAIDIEMIKSALFGKDRLNGLVGWVQDLRTKMWYVLGVGAFIIAVLGWLTKIHVVK